MTYISSRPAWQDLEFFCGVTFDGQIIEDSSNRIVRQEATLEPLTIRFWK